MIVNVEGINMRQVQILKIVHEKPNLCLSVKEIENRFSVSNFTARSDLEKLVNLGYLSEIKLNKVKSGYIKSDRFDNLINEKL
jgi:DeoR/GlpR family transcriptional regulator of sugar metabolism